MIRSLAMRLADPRLFDAVVPKDRGARRIVSAAAYGSDRRHRLDLYAPRRPMPGPMPVILFFYGGGWLSGDRRGYSFVGRALANAGYLVAIPDYRLAPAHPYPDFMEDSAAALRWVRARAADHGGDADRLIVSGQSAGAYNAAMLALDPCWLGADRGAVRGLVGLAGPYDFLPLDSHYSIAAFGHLTDLAPTQPINHASVDAPPALLLHGSADETVGPRHSLELAKRLKEAGVKAEAKIYDGIGHIGILAAIARPFRRRAPVLADMIAFADRVTAG